MRERELENGGPFAAPLARLEQNRAAYFGSAWARMRRREEHLRPTSCVLKLQIEGGARVETAFVKVGRVGSVRPRARAQATRGLLDDFVQQERAHAALPTSVARPIACFPELMTVVTEGARGRPLSELVKRGALDELQLTFARAGAWLAAYHATGSGERRASLDKLHARVDAHLRRMIELGAPLDLEERRKVLRTFDGLATRVPEAELRAVPLHGDFSLENVVAEGDRVTVLDFDVSGGAEGCWLHDVAYLYTCLARLSAKPWTSRAATGRLQSALLRGLDPQLTPERPLFRLMLLVHTTCGLVDAVEWHRPAWKRAWNLWLWRPYRSWLGL